MWQPLCSLLLKYREQLNCQFDCWLRKCYQSTWIALSWVTKHPQETRPDSWKMDSLRVDRNDRFHIGEKTNRFCALWFWDPQFWSLDMYKIHGNRSYSIVLLMGSSSKVKDLPKRCVMVAQCRTEFGVFRVFRCNFQCLSVDDVFFLLPDVGARGCFCCWLP